MRPLSAILIGLLVFSMAMGSQIYALFGPCTTISEGDYTSTITCSGGVCIGHATVIRSQSLCEDEDDVPCDQNYDAVRFITYDVATFVNLTFEDLLYAGLDAACALFVLGVVAAVGWTGVGAAIGTVAFSVVCGFVGRDIVSLIDACSFTTCYPDMDKKEERKGGRTCD